MRPESLPLGNLLRAREMSVPKMEHVVTYLVADKSAQNVCNLLLSPVFGHWTCRNDSNIRRMYRRLDQPTDGRGIGIVVLAAA